MIARILVKNLYSFNEETEFNMFPCKTQHLPHHKTIVDGINVLRIGAIYGANGAGKTNLIKIVSLLTGMIRNGKITPYAKEVKFKLLSQCANSPSSIGIEFIAERKCYYYTITFDENGVLFEGLYESHKQDDVVIFEREFVGDKESISMGDSYAKTPDNELFINILEDKLIKRKDLLITFLNNNYSDDFVSAGVAYKWLTSTLVVMRANEETEALSLVFDKNSNLLEYANNVLKAFGTGVVSLSIEKEFIDDSSKYLSRIVGGNLFVSANGNERLFNSATGDSIEIESQDGKMLSRHLMASHTDISGNGINLPFGIESDGTKRLAEYLPVLYDLVYGEHDYLIDEIERSIHPILIKAIISKLSEGTDVKGQIIFTTHESCLLDQAILRPDEIWFAEKDAAGSSHLYSLSDFNVHHTANIENGYLDGRYGAIPFVANLKDLHWSNE